MNIFRLSEDPKIAASMLCDKHIVKMPLETAQMLCSVWHRYNIKDVPYKEAFKNHPCTRWVGDSVKNYIWTWEHGLELCKEYTRRYGKIHKCEDIIQKVKPDINKMVRYFDSYKTTRQPQCMNEEYKNKWCSVAGYQTYYYFAKYLKGIAKWDRLNNEPAFIKQCSLAYRL